MNLQNQLTMACFTSDWVDFFLKAGIPSDEAASYALIFTRNRIQRNMLADLNKEYLKDMGINLLGDIIAILKHAQTENENESRAFVMSQHLHPAVKEAVSKSPAIKSGSSSVKNLLDRYTKQYKEAEKNLRLVPKVEVMEDLPNNYIIPEPKVKPPPQRIFDKPSSCMPKKRKLEEDETESMPKQKKVKSTNTDTKVEKTSIFTRLGDSSVSSTTGEVSTVVKTSMSVFSRLGDMLAGPPTQSSDTGLLKEKAKISTLSMRADQIQINKEPSKGVMMTFQKTKTDFLKARDLEMLKITTEFSDDDDVVPSPSQLPPEPKLNKSKPTIIRNYTEKGEIDVIDTTDCTSLISDTPPKRVRFGGTTTRILPVEPKKRRNPLAFPNHNFLARKLHAARLINRRKQLANSGAVSQMKKANNLVSKMVSDTMSNNRFKLSVKKRIQTKNKVSVLDRLG